MRIDTTPNVSSATGTANQVLVNTTSGSPVNGAITLATPQDIATTSTPQFGGLGIGQAASAISKVSVTGTRTGGAPTTAIGAFSAFPDATYTNNVTAGGAQAPDFGFITFGQPTIDGNDGGTYSNHAATVYIKGSPLDTSGSNRFVVNNPYSFWVDAGNVRIDDKLIVGGNTIDTARTWTYNISFNDDAAKTIGIERTTAVGTVGRNLSVYAGSCTAGGTNLTGGSLYNIAGDSTGTGSSSWYVYTAAAGSTGTTARVSAERMKITGNAMTMTATSQFNAQVNIGSTNWATDTNLYVRAGATSPAIFYVLYDSTYKDALTEKEWFTANNNMFFGTSTAHSLLFYTNGAQKGYITSAGSFVFGGSALATNATDGFVYIPSCAGAPTGTPTAQSGTKAMIYDSTNNKLYVYNGAWKSVTLA